MQAENIHYKCVVIEILLAKICLKLCNLLFQNLGGFKCIFSHHTALDTYCLYIVNTEH